MSQPTATCKATLEHLRALGIDAHHADNILQLVRLAEARGRAGRWPRMDYELHADWRLDGVLIRRIADLAGLPSDLVMSFYRTHHAIGLLDHRHATKDQAP